MSESDYKRFAYLDYHEASANASREPGPPSSDWPEHWKRIYFKGYPRFPRVALPSSTQPSNLNIKECLSGRRSCRDFARHAEIDLVTLTNVMSGIKNTSVDEVEYDSRRPYPSAGARYPVEVYILALSVSGLLTGVYHYNFRHNCLEYLWPVSEAQMKLAFPYQDFCRECSALVVFSAFFERSCVKYGERGYRYCLIEAGHMAQNLCLLAESLGISTCPNGGFHDEELNRLLDLDPSQEAAIYSLALGKNQLFLNSLLNEN